MGHPRNPRRFPLPSIANLFFGFFPLRFDAGDPQMDLERWYQRF